jgi:membrane protein implicated in regulation of membrane protease activity
MTEFRAILLVFAAGMILTVVACLALGAMHASGTAYALVAVLLISAGADTCSRVGMHYTSKRHPR